MRRLFTATLASLVVAAPTAAQDTTLVRILSDSLETEAVRSRAFIRGAETQLSKVIRLAADLEAALAFVTPAPNPEPDPTPDPDPSPDPDPVEGELLAINWSTALGNSVEAVGDGGKGIMRWCDWPRVLSVVDGGSVGLPLEAGNALGIRSIQNCGHVEFENLFPTPAAGQVWGMSYYAMNEAGQTDTKMHPHCLWPVGQIQAVPLSITARGGGSWTPHPRFAIEEFPFGVLAYVDGAPLVLDPGVWVRYEVEMEWLSGTTFRVRPKLYNLDGTLLTDDFRGTDWPQARLVDQVGSIANPEYARTPSFGMGQAGSSGARYFVADARFWVR